MPAVSRPSLCNEPLNCVFSRGKPVVAYNSSPAFFTFLSTAACTVENAEAV